MTTQIQQFQVRRGTAAEWSAANPVLLDGEQGLETDTRKVKIGDGSTHWADLEYLIYESVASVNGKTGPAVTLAAADVQAAPASLEQYSIQRVPPTTDPVTVTVGAANTGASSWYGSGVWVDLIQWTPAINGIVVFRGGQDLDGGSQSDVDFYIYPGTVEGTDFPSLTDQTGNNLVAQAEWYPNWGGPPSAFYVYSDTTYTIHVVNWNAATNAGHRIDIAPLRAVLAPLEGVNGPAPAVGGIYALILREDGTFSPIEVSLKNDGDHIVTNGYDSHAEGAGTKALGDTSHAEGYLTQTFGKGGHAEGHSTISVRSAQSTRGIEHVQQSDDFYHRKGNGSLGDGWSGDAVGSGAYSILPNRTAVVSGTAISSNASIACCWEFKMLVMGGNAGGNPQEASPATLRVVGSPTVTKTFADTGTEGWTFTPSATGFSVSGVTADVETVAYVNTVEGINV